MQVPDFRIVNVVPETAQILDVAVVKATLKPDEEVADKDDGVAP